MLYNGWLIYKRADAMKNNDYIEWFIHAATQERLQLQLICREELAICIRTQKVLYEGKAIKLPDFAVVRIMEPFLSVQLEQVGVPCFNSSAISAMANDKAKTYAYARSVGVEYLQTFTYPANVFPDAPPIPYPFVMKPTTGKGGANVCYVSNETMYQEAKINLQNEAYILQEANVQLGKDLRVFVVGNEIITAILRENSRDFRANYTLGGNATIYTLSNDDEALIKKIIASHTFDFVGIDFLMDKNNELIFNEIEDVVGSRTVSQLTDINIVARYVQHISKTLQNT